jgi:hypothetical protein
MTSIELLSNNALSLTEIAETAMAIEEHIVTKHLPCKKMAVSEEKARLLENFFCFESSVK